MSASNSIKLLNNIIYNFVVSTASEHKVIIDRQQNGSRASLLICPTYPICQLRYYFIVCGFV